MRAPRVILAGLVSLAVFHAAYYWPQLPDTVAAHFDGAGRANGWSSRAAFFAVYAFTVALLVGCFAGLPRLVGRIPDSLWNLPNRDFWLAPERRAATVARLEHGMLWFGDGALVFVIATMHLAIRANLPGDAFDARAMWVSLGAFLVFTAVWLMRFLRSWRRPR